MTKRISTFAIMAFLASSLAFAAEKAKATTQTATTNNSQQDNSSCNKKGKHNAKPAPSKQDREFDRSLLGIYG